MSRIRLIALDIDGTLLDSRDQLTEETGAAVRAAAASGVHIVLATGRWYGSARRWAARLGSTAPIISHSGARVTRQQPETDLLHLGLPLQPARELAAFMDAHQMMANVTVGPVTYMRPRAGLDPARLPPDINVVTAFLPVVTVEPTSVLVFDPAGIDVIPREFGERFGGSVTFLVNRTSGTADHLTLHHPEVDKGRALALVCNLLDIDPAEAMAIGDAESDTAMFRIAGVSVAMGNAGDAVKAQAGHIAPSNDAGGVAWALRTLL